MKFHGWLDEGRCVENSRKPASSLNAWNSVWILYFSIGFSFALQIGIYQLRSFVSDCFVLDIGLVNFDITTLNRYVLALCFDAFKTFDLRYWFFPW
ncbi:unnamed protein product [Rhizophagus irregularis]|nr:unnamed protein product [Rhizophagus irregularis]